MAVLLIGTAGGPVLSPTVSFCQLFGYFLLVISSVLVLRVLVLVFRRDRQRRLLGPAARRIRPEPDTGTASWLPGRAVR
jgi:hypothetical protein